MGVCNSVETVARVSVLEQQLVKAVLQSKARQAQHTGQHTSFNALLLKFPKMRPGFIRVQELFKQAAPPGSKHMTLLQFQQAAPKLGLNDQSAALQQIFQVAQVQSRSGIGWEELVVVYTVVYLTEEDQSIRSQVPAEVATGLEIVEKAFAYFDNSGDGYLERSELLTVLKSGTKVFGSSKRAHGTHKQRSVGEMLFEMLDFDQSGRISFKEFLLGMVKLVVQELEDDELQEIEDFLQNKGNDSLARNTALNSGQAQESGDALEQQPKPATGSDAAIVHDVNGQTQGVSQDGDGAGEGHEQGDKSGT